MIKTKMKEKIKKLWVAALRSGEYKQGKGALIKYKVDSSNGIPHMYKPNEETLKGATYCCLGVLCDLYRKETGMNLWSDTAFDYVHGTLSNKMLAWAGLVNSNPQVKINDGHTLTSLSALNDHQGYNFEAIADIIEKQL